MAENSIGCGQIIEYIQGLFAIVLIAHL